MFIILRALVLPVMIRAIPAQDARFSGRLQETIVGTFSVVTFQNTTVLINLNCELEPHFRLRLLASHLSLGRLTIRGTKRRAQADKETVSFGARFAGREPKDSFIDEKATYSEAFLTTDNEDRFYLGLYCHLEKRAEHAFDVHQSLRNVKAPSHSFAVLWIGDATDDSFGRETQPTAPYTRIFEAWQRETGKLESYATEQRSKKLYNHFLALYFNFNLNGITPCTLESLKFGRISV